MLDARLIDIAPGGRHDDRVSWKFVFVGAVVAVLAVGWFALSLWDMGSQVLDAVGEAVGVGFALLVVVSTIGAVLDRDRE